MFAIKRSQMPTDEVTLRQALASYLSELESHKTSIGLPKPWPMFDILFAITETGNADFVVVEDEQPLPPVLTLDQVKMLARQNIDAARESAIASGVTYAGNPFQSDPESVRNVNGVLGAINSGLALPAGFTWRTTDNRDVPFTASDVRALAGIMFSHGWEIYNKSWALKSQIMAAQAEADVQAVKW